METETIGWSDFERVCLCAGTIVEVEDFPEARKPAYKLLVDFGPHGVKRSSAQITKLYTRDDLIGRQVLGVVNFAPKRIGPVLSEALVTGFILADGVVVLAQPERPVPNGIRLA